MPAPSSGFFARNTHAEAVPREADAQRALADLFPHLKSASLQAARQHQPAPAAPAERAAATSARFLLG